MPLASACSQFDRIDPKVKLFKVYRAARTVTHTHTVNLPGAIYCLFFLMRLDGWETTYLVTYLCAYVFALYSPAGLRSDSASGTEIKVSILAALGFIENDRLKWPKGLLTQK